jgi:hypothetical protein
MRALNLSVIAMPSATPEIAFVEKVFAGSKAYLR